MFTLAEGPQGIHEFAQAMLDLERIASRQGYALDLRGISVENKMGVTFVTVLGSRYDEEG